MHSLICDGEYRSLDKHERERRRRLVIWSSCLIMAVFLLAISLAVLNNPKPKTDIHIVSKGANFIKTTAASAAASNGMVTAACKSTLYPAACESALGGSAAKSLNDIFSASVESAKLRASSARALAYNLTVPKSKSKAKTASFGRPTALDDCLELLDISLEQLDDVINSKGKSKQSADDIHTWLSAALTHQVTCSDGMAAAGGDDAVGIKAMSAEVSVLSQYISNALALHAKLKRKAGRGRRLRNEFQIG
ncbi:hypothetical protein HPP92_005459 [Vanilla planifolia]|uniref:Pectinesterase inhibitor domain-containing protein n=1 Tax=Vanilla planifolia TaxID=51239 RepID=A0A835VCJ1_VANPL|nr:hypothetical protein HPP92_005796 [Vanilla planifolia]KAG0494465.1 hypothetical protein HPP92_005459 [Vanilla planifolia]